MDAASRVELEGLRRRAFGPNPDIHDDPAALARLIELEELAQPRTGEEPAAAAEPDTDSGSLARDPIATDPVTAEGPPRRSRAQRATIIAGLAAAAAIVTAVVIAQPQAEPLPTASPTPAASPAPTTEPQYVLTADENSGRLMSIDLNAPFGGYTRVPMGAPAPPFDDTTPLAWTNHLGEYYGWDLWVAGGAGGAGAAGDQHCILIQRADVTNARCGYEPSQRAGLLHVSLASSDIPPGELSEPLEADESIRFWWLESGVVDVIRGSFDSE